MNEVLKPCPFCGGTMSIVLCGGVDEYQLFVMGGRGEKKCTCKVFMESEQYQSKTDGENEKEKLIKKWNSRVEENDEIIKMLKQMQVETAKCQGFIEGTVTQGWVIEHLLGEKIKELGGKPYEIHDGMFYYET